jgi:hypothetical protein
MYGNTTMSLRGRRGNNNGVAEGSPSFFAKNIFNSS